MKNDDPVFLLISKASHAFSVLYKHDLMLPLLHTGFSFALNKMILSCH